MTIRVIIVLLLFPYVVPAQNPDEWQALEFGSEEDYRTHEGKILECANFVLGMPAVAGNPARKNAMSAISKWMSGTPDFSFTIDESIGQLMQKNDAVLSIYMASMTKFVLENRNQADDEKQVKLKSFETLLNYCENQNHKVPMTKELKKAIDAKNKGKLKQYLGL